jgi:alkanesulfonate monooxygenase
VGFEFLWYIPNQVTPGHRGEPVTAGHNSLDTLTSQARALEEHGWKGALIGAGWGRPDTFTVATALAARTATFEPLIAVRPGYWHPANFAKAGQLARHRHWHGVFTVTGPSVRSRYVLDRWPGGRAE